ncbi:MAG TPA: hypothetical protein VJ436_00355 [Anaerolineales bacterium]|nr:hypothetical protein [Anaerolineales bacterium]
MRIPLTRVVAGAIGLVILLGYFLRIEALDGLRGTLLEWALILAAVALLIGIANLFYVHWRKLIAGGANSFYSAALIIALVITLGVVGWFGPTHAYSLWIFNHIQVPIETTLVALLAVVLVFTGARLLHRRSDLFAVLFFGSVLLALLGSIPFLSIQIPGLYELRAWVAQVPAVAGARGLLLGIALGMAATGLRVLIGADRSSGG